MAKDGTVREYMKSEQKDGGEFLAEDTYRRFRRSNTFLHFIKMIIF